MHQNENGYTNVAAFELSFGVFGTDKLHIQSNHGDQKRNHGHIANKGEDRSQIGNAHGLPKFVEQQAGISGEEGEGNGTCQFGDFRSLGFLLLFLVMCALVIFVDQLMAFSIHQLKSHKQRNTSEDDGEKDLKQSH